MLFTSPTSVLPSRVVTEGPAGSAATRQDVTSAKATRARVNGMIVLITDSKFLVPTLRVGTHVLDALRRLQHSASRDAERPDLRSHAERGNEEERRES